MSSYPDQSRAPRSRHLLAVAIHLLLLSVLYAQTGQFDYVYYDDEVYVLDNPYVRAGLTADGIGWAFTTLHMANWHPLTWISHMLDVSLFGLDPGWAHLHSALLHGLIGLLVYVFLLRLSCGWWQSLVLSLVFLVHPLHVESVAWIAERKDLLCAFFFMLGIVLYDSYRQRPRLRQYLFVVAAYALSLMAKPMAVTLPAVLLVLDVLVYRDQILAKSDGRAGIFRVYTKIFAEKIPLFALSAGLSIVAIIAMQQGETLRDLEVVSLMDRIANASVGYTLYLQQMLMPIELAAYYPLQDSTWRADLLPPAVVLLAWFAISVRYPWRYPLLSAGFCWYVVTLLPVIGLVQVGNQAHADRYMYLPSVGVLLALAQFLPARGSRYFNVAALLSTIFIAYFSVICFWQVGYWQNRHTLFTRVQDVSGPNWRTHIHLALDYTQRGMFEEALGHGEAALVLDPVNPQSHQSLGDIYVASGDFKRAETIYLQAIDSGYFSGKMFHNLGTVFAAQGNVSAAIEAYEIALSMEPTMRQTAERIASLRLLESAGEKQ